MIDDRPFYERVDADKPEIIAAMKFQIRIFVEDELEKDNDVSWRDFVAKHSEWNHEPLYEIIVDEIVRVMKIVAEESRNHV